MENNYEDIQTCRMFDITLDEYNKKFIYTDYDIKELLKQLAEKDKEIKELRLEKEGK